MSYQHSIRKLLGIKDGNISFPDEAVREEKINGLTSKVIQGRLTYRPESCTVCGCVNEGTIVRNGHKKTRTLLPDMGGYPTYLELRKQRFLCRECGSSFSAETPVVKKRCHISSATKLSIAVKATRSVSEKEIAREHHVSPNTTRRVFDQFYATFSQSYRQLPENLAIDEFKSVKDSAGAMSLIICDSDKRKIFDILQDRKQKTILDYFLRFPQEQRAQVKTVVVDLYGPYQKLFRTLFPKADLIIDRFHIITQVNRALNSARITLMNRFRHSRDAKERRDYTKLKRYWKLLLKGEEELDFRNYHYQRPFKGLMTERGIVDYLLSLDESLRQDYQAYQAIRFAVGHRKVELFRSFIHGKHHSLSSKMEQAIRTFRKAEPYIVNALTYAYSNGLVEGINNKIKVIKRVAYGYRRFSRFRNRIFIQFNLLDIKKEAPEPQGDSQLPIRACEKQPSSRQ